MVFLAKFLLTLLVFALVGGFIINQVPSWKQKVVEVINPAAKEARVLGELKSNLDKLGEELITVENSKNFSEAKPKINTLRQILTKTKELTDSALKINSSNSGLIGSVAGRIIDSLIDKAPYPADHLGGGNQTANSQKQNQNIICPTPTKP